MLEGSGVSARMVSTRLCITLWNVFVAAAPSLTSCSRPQPFRRRHTEPTKEHTDVTAEREVTQVWGTRAL